MERTIESNRYETVFVLHLDHAGKAKEFIDRFTKIIEGFNGVVTHIEEWGSRELAYHIQKQSKGYYSLMQFTAPPTAVAELDRNLKLSEGVIRHLTVRLEDETPATTLEPEARAPSQGGDREPAKPEP
jgi:small subunit ribosomal protein S6